MVRLKEHYSKVISPDLALKLNLMNSQELPRLDKIIITSSANPESKHVRGVVQETNAIKKKSKKLTKASKGNSTQSARKSPNDRMWESIPHQVRVALLLISGQRSSEKQYRVTRPGLKVRKNQVASFQTTLRDDSMYFFLDRLVNEVLPNIENFSALQSSLSVKSASPWLDDGSKQKWCYGSYFDSNGNFHIGIKSFYSFREIDQNSRFNKLNGFNITIVTTAETDSVSRLLLSGFQLPWTK